MFECFAVQLSTSCKNNPARKLPPRSLFADPVSGKIGSVDSKNEDHQMSLAPDDENGGMSGCLIFGIIALVILGLAGVALFFLLFQSSPAPPFIYTI